ncbi:major facilitator superfamily domain-containing protein [Tirmania nivea]|nr:major facilitator superfamily domain-containing protein [Tirmania nivea]
MGSKASIGGLSPSPSSQPINTTGHSEKSGEASTPTLTKQEKKEVWKYRAKLFAGLVLPFFLNSIDVTIIATALPHIAADFGQLSQQSWIVTAFTITDTAFIPAFGQLCDVFGRHSVLQFALLLMWVGSALCAGAQTFWMLLFGRAITGVSSSGLLVVTTVVLSDKVSLKENALQNTLFSLIAGASFSVGPVIGGYLTSLHWRYCFGLSVPLSLIAHVLAYYCLRPILVKAQTERGLSRTASGATVVHHRQLSFLQKMAVVDWEGLTLFLVACVCIILALSWGGATYAWDSPQIIVLLIVGVVFILLFMVVEKGMEENGWLKEWAASKSDGSWLKSRRAMIPLKLFDSKDVCILAFLNFAGGITLYSMFYFISVYFTIVAAYPPEKAGLQLLLYIPGLGGGVYAAMYMCNVYPAQTFPPIFLGTGLVIPIALGLLTHALNIRAEGFILGMMAMSGFGSGITIMPVPLHAIARKPKQLANIVATLQFFDPLGGTVALAIMSSVLNNKVGGSGIGDLVEGSGRRGSSSNGNIMDKLTPEDLEVVKHAVKEGVRWAFLSILPIVVLAGILTWGLGNVNIDLKKLDERMEEQEAIDVNESNGENSMWEREKLALVSYWELTMKFFNI